MDCRRRFHASAFPLFAARPQLPSSHPPPPPLCHLHLQLLPAAAALDDSITRGLLASAADGATPPPRQVALVITGSGPGKEGFKAAAAAAALNNVSIHLVWLADEVRCWRLLRRHTPQSSASALDTILQDYPLFLSCCDAGVCLHQSSSGIDLPMKVSRVMRVAVPPQLVAWPDVCPGRWSTCSAADFRCWHSTTSAYRVMWLRCECDKSLISLAFRACARRPRRPFI